MTNPPTSGDADLAEARARIAELESALENARVVIANTRTNAMSEISKGNSRWDGCPELLAGKLLEISAALASPKETER